MEYFLTTPYLTKSSYFFLFLVKELFFPSKFFKLIVKYGKVRIDALFSEKHAFGRPYMFLRFCCITSVVLCLSST